MSSSPTTMSLPNRVAHGTCLFFTGLSGAGKSTLAAAVAARLGQLRPITLLDGDAVRQHLSSELGFSREHRDLNIRRIAFVAGEVVKHGGIAICAAIAPYDAARRAARTIVEANGRFILIHLDTPLSVCEARDVKGLYAKARAGSLQGFTGVSDPYESPTDADLTIDTSRTSVDAAVAQILDVISVERS